MSYQALARITARADRALAGLEAQLVREIRNRMTVSLRGLLQEVRILYRRSQDELAAQGAINSGTAYRLARARVTIEQMAGTFEAFERNTAQVGRLLERASEAYRLTADIAQQAIDLYGPQSLSLSTPINQLRLRSIVENAAVRLHRHSVENIDRIKQAVVNATVRNTGYQRLAREIRASTGLMQSRAEMIARTELHNSAADAREATYLSRGVEFVIRMVTIDDRTCPVCGARMGEVTRLSETREVLHPRCRCVLQPFYPEWIEDGFFDPAEFLEERTEILRLLEEQGLEPKYGKTSFEEQRPEVIWRPGMNPAILERLPAFTGMQ